MKQMQMCQNVLICFVLMGGGGARSVMTQKVFTIWPHYLIPRPGKLTHTTIIAFDSISCYFMLLLYILGYFTHFLGVCNLTDGSKNLEFYKFDLTIRFLVLINLPIQSSKHLTPFLAILCHFDVFWGILRHFLGVCDVTNDKKQNLIVLTSSVDFLSRQTYPYQI